MWPSTRKFCRNDRDKDIQKAINSVEFFDKTDSGAILSDSYGKQIFVLQK